MNKDMMNKYFSACSQPQSNYAVEHFVDGSKLTPERRFRQAVIELESATEVLEDAEYYVAKLDAKIRKMKSKVFKSKPGTTKVVTLNLKIDRDVNRMVRAKRKLEGKRKEMLQHLTILESLEKELGFDQEITEEEIYNILQNAEANYYLLKLAADTAAHIVSKNGGPAPGVLLALQQMPKADIDRFNEILQGMYTSMQGNAYVPALHGEGGIEEIRAIGRKVLEEAEKAKQLQDK